MRLMPQTPSGAPRSPGSKRAPSELRAEIYAHLTPWQVVQVARHPNRPCMLDYVERLFTELHRARTAIAASRTTRPSSPGSAYFHDVPVAVVGHQKGRDTKQKIYRNFGYAKPEGYRKALRVMRLAEKFKRPVDHLHRHAGGLSGHRVGGARRRGGDCAQPARDGADRCADRRDRVRRRRQRRRARHRDRRPRADAGVQRSTASSRPKGARRFSGATATRKVEAAEALKITAPDLLGLGLVDEIVKEPPGGAHTRRTTRPRRSSTTRSGVIWRSSRRSARRRRASTRATRSSARWAGSDRRSRTTVRPRRRCAGPRRRAS